MAYLKKTICMLAISIAVIAAFLGFLIFLPIIIPALIWLNHISKKEAEAFRLEYQHFLDEHEGQKFFCYTSRKNSKNWIEQEILPNLDVNIEVVLLEGKTPKSKFPRKFISHSLYHLKNVGFPNVMKVVNGQMLDSSLHSELYETINQNLDPQKLLEELNIKLKSLGL